MEYFRSRLVRQRKLLRVGLDGRLKIGTPLGCMVELVKLYLAGLEEGTHGLIGGTLPPIALALLLRSIDQLVMLGRRRQPPETSPKPVRG